MVGTIVKPKSEDEEIEQRRILHGSESIKGIQKYGAAYLIFAVAFTVAMLFAYAIPYLNAIE